MSSSSGITNVGRLLMIAIMTACGSNDEPYALRKISAEANSTSVVRTPAKLTSIESGQKDALGRRTRVACVTCHSQRHSEVLPQNSQELDEFHRGLVFRHGGLACSSCHVAGQRSHELLHLANGTQIAMTEVMSLCGQCHGPQLRDYRRGAHGGMTGYWDLRQGVRVRNNCVDCHDPHTPQIPGVLPVLKPRDRFLESTSHGQDVK